MMIQTLLDDGQTKHLTQSRALRRAAPTPCATAHGSKRGTKPHSK